MVDGNEELEGTTFKVYLFVAKENRPVGTRDVIRNLGLSSSSVAFRHLQKLETLGLVQKNEYGEYTLKEKAGIQGHIWIGRTLTPRLIFYSMFFLGILTVQIIIIARLLLNNEFPDTTFFYLTGVTGAAMIILLIEGSLLRKNMQRK